MSSQASNSTDKQLQRPRWLEYWDRFWFEPRSPVAIAIFRILFGLIVLENLVIHIWPDFDIYYSKNNLIPIRDMIPLYWHNDHMFDLLLLFPNEDKYIYACFYVLVGAAVCMTLGLFTRLSSWLVFLLMMSFGHHFELNQNAGDNYIRITAMCLAMSNCGDALSIDAVLKSLKQDWRKTGFQPVYSAPWAQRLIQLQLMIAYMHTWLCKIEGARWNDGTAVYYAVRYDDIIRFPIPHFLDQLWFYQLSTWGTLFVEFIIWNLIWWKPARYWVMLTGVLLHLGIEYFMNLPMFEWTFMFTYILFIDPEDMTKLWNKLKAWVEAKFGPPQVVVFDSANLACVKYIGFLHRMDILGRLKPVDGRAPENKEFLAESGAENIDGQVMYYDGNKKWLTGFDAFRAAVISSPLLFPLGVLGSIPVISLPVSMLYAFFTATSGYWFGMNKSKATAEIVSGGAAT